MKKRGIVAGACIVAFFAVLGAIANINPAFAAGNIFKIKSAEITGKSTQTEASISNFTDTTATNSIIFHNVGEYVEYKFTFENTDTQARRVLRATIAEDNAYLSYDYDGTIEASIDPSAAFDLTFKAIYSNEIESASLAQQQFDTTITIAYEDVEGQTQEQTVVITPDPDPKPTQNTEPSDNPTTSSDAALIQGAIIIFAISTTALAAVILYTKKHRKAAATLVAIIAMATPIAVLSVGATTTLNDTFTLENNVTFSYSECQGICYYANGDDVVGTMADQDATANAEVILYASNFSRDGYGFVGWNTKADGTGTNFGPNETITVPESGTLKLYARWLKSTGKMTGFTCESLALGEITALTDERDDQTYAVARLTNGTCWTIENMRYAMQDSWNDNTTARAENPEIDDAIYSYGNYYTEDSARNGDICPTDWDLPSGDDGGDYDNLYNQISPNAQTSNEELLAWTKFPNNFVYSGLHYLNGASTFGASTDDVMRGTMAYYFGGDAIYDHGNSSYNIYGLMFANADSIYGTSLFMQANYPMTLGAGSGVVARCVTAANRTITLSYDANGGENPPTSQSATTKKANYEFDISNEEPERNHYSFYAWVKESGKDKVPGVNYIDDEEKFNAGDKITIGNDTTLYALWTKNCTTIHYMPNGSAVEGTMNDQQVCPPKTNIDLIAPNFSLAGSGFIGWNTKADGTGDMYGPNQQIDIPELDDVYLYAQWVSAETGVTMQSFVATNEPYASAETNTVIGLRDERDNQVYAVAKLPDGHWWMIENLRLDLNDANTNITTTNTNHPTTAFIEEWELRFHGNGTATMADCNNSTHDCEDQISFGASNINRNLPADYTDETQNTSWYEYGVNYNWYTATAGNGNHSTPGKAGGDICSSGWHLPRGGTNEETAKLDKSLGGTGADNDSVEGSNRWRSYPVNVVYNGSMTWLDGRQKASARGETGRLWSGSARQALHSTEQGLGVWIHQERATVGYMTTTNKWYAYGARCVANYEETYEITFDANGGENPPATITGTASDGRFSFTIPNEQPIKQGKRFLGWSQPRYQYDEPDYRIGETVTVYDLKTTYYAVWGD